MTPIEIAGISMAVVASWFGGYLRGNSGCNGHHFNNGTWQTKRTAKAHIKYNKGLSGSGQHVVITRNKNYKCKDCGKLKKKREEYEIFDVRETRQTT